VNVGEAERLIVKTDVTEICRELMQDVNPIAGFNIYEL
jgi:hypothetical protein